MNIWLGVVAPSGTPKAVIERINAEFNRVLKLPAVRDKLASQGIEASGGTPEELGRRMRVDFDTYSRVVKAANIRAD